MRIKILLFPSLVIALGFFSSVSRAATPLTNSELVRKATADLSQQVEKIVVEKGENTPKIALRASQLSGFNQTFQDALAPALLGRGFDVWILDKGQQPQPGALVFEYKLSQASLKYPAEQHGFLGLGTPTIGRVLDLSIDGRLESPEDGRLYWQGQPSIQLADRISLSQLQTAKAGQPTWVLSPKQEATSDSHAGFFEKLTIAGLVGAVVALYISGAQ
jgi:hypothetical protein